MSNLSAASWVVFGLAAFLVGFSKTSVGGLATISIVIFASQLPARESTGALLPLLLVGDVVAVTAYRRHANWAMLARLFPGVAVGVVAGAFFVSRVDDDVMRRTIGIVLLALAAVQLASRLGRAGGDPDDRTPARRTASRRAGTTLVGTSAGFVTMVANAAGSLTTMYFLLAGLPMLEFLGTGAWFFLVVNVFKLPFSIGLGLVDWSSVTADAFLAPLVVAGGLAGLWFIRRINQRQFEWLALVLAAVAAVPLVL